MKQMDKKTLKKVHVWVRAVIQLLYFLFIPSAIIQPLLTV